MGHVDDAGDSARERPGALEVLPADRFLIQGRALVLIGPAGLGKTHLAVSIGLAMLKRG